MLAAYGLRLLGNPVYGWWPVLIPLLTLVFVWLRWDMRVEFPRHLMALLALSLGIIAAFLSALLRSDWLAGVGLVSTSGAFLVSHHQRDGKSLAPIWYLWWSILRLPGDGTSQLTLFFAEQVEKSTRSILRFANLPHVEYSSAIEIPGARYYFDQNIYSMLSWPLFIAAAMFYSSLMRRTWIEAALNLLQSLFWCFAFHIALFLSCVLIPLPPNSWQVPCAAALWGIVAFALFLSSERGVRVLLQPISESSSDARLINPLVLAWNWCLTVRTKTTSKWRIAETWFQSPALWVFAVAVCLTLLVQLIQSPRALAAWAAVRPLRVDAHELAEFMFTKGEDFDYRHTRHSPPLVLAREVDIWTSFAPLATTEHILDIHERQVFDLSTIFSNLGSSTLDVQMDEMEFILIKLPSGQPLTYGKVDIRIGKQPAYLLFAWLSPNGEPLDPSNHLGMGYLLMSKVELVVANQQATKTRARGEFSRFVVGVQNQLIAYAGSP